MSRSSRLKLMHTAVQADQVLFCAWTSFDFRWGHGAVLVMAWQQTFDKTFPDENKKFESCESHEHEASVRVLSSGLPNVAKVP